MARGRGLRWTWKGDAPLLLSKPLLISLGRVLDFREDELTLTKFGVSLILEEASSGTYLVDVLDLSDDIDLLDDYVDDVEVKEPEVILAAAVNQPASACRGFQGVDRFGADRAAQHQQGV